jgi:hypothetical protein
MTPTPEEQALIDAYIDKELDHDDAVRAKQLLEERADLRSYADQQRRLKERLDAAFSPIANAEIPPRLIDAAQRSPMPIGAASQPSAWASIRHLLPIAAAVVFSLALGLFLGRTSTSSVIGVGRDGAAVAQGPLARALTTQLAADPGTIAIGLSFHNKDGAMCRTFASPSLAGIACRKANTWLITDLATGDGPIPDPAKFQTTGAPLPQHLRDRIKDMIRGDVLDAAAERAARDRGWRSQ